MKPRDAETRSLLAGEYVLGTLRGKARDRFELWLRSDPALRREVSRWEQRLHAMNDGAREVAPNPQTWQRIAARVAPGSTDPGRGWLSTLAFWRWFSAVSAAVAAVLVAYVTLTPPEVVPPPGEAMVVVLADRHASPAMTVAWSPEGAGRPRLRIRVIGHAEMAPDTSWELWLMPGPDAPPLSLGLITTDETQVIELPTELRGTLNAAAGMAMSVEPRHGSPTGRPTGPVLYSGSCVKI